MSEKERKKIHWRTVIVAVLISLALSSSGQVSYLVNKSRDVENTLLKQKNTNAEQKRQIDDLKRELEELKRELEELKRRQ